MPCKKLVQEVSNFLDNELDTTLRRELEEHLNRCPECRIIVDTTRKTIQIFRGIEPYPLPASLHHRLEQAIQQRYSRINRKSSR